MNLESKAGQATVRSNTPSPDSRKSASSETTKRIFALAGTLITGLGVLLATTLENKAANEGENPKDLEKDDSQSSWIDNHPTGSLPDSTAANAFEKANGMGPAAEIFEGVSAEEAEAAQIQLASLFGGMGNANENSPPSDETAVGGRPLTGTGSTEGLQVVETLGVSHPGQPISKIADVQQTQGAAVNNLYVSGGTNGFDGTVNDVCACDPENEEQATDLDANRELIGTNISDTLMGGNGDDRLFGLGEKDFLTGGAGADHLDGGDGDEDVAEYVTSQTGVNVSLRDGLGYTGDAEGDTLVNIEFVHGSLHDDWIEGDDNTNRLEGRLGIDELFGLGGNDRLLGGYGADYLDGGEGSDIADYSWSDEGVVVDLSTGLGSEGEAEGDVLISIENLMGSLSDDSLTGDNLVNRLWGNEGNDNLFGGGGNDRLDGGLGADLLDGGAGIDIADYSNAQSGVSLSLETGGISGEAAGDTFQSIENVYGSDFNDNIAGDDNANRLVGNSGDDVLYGAAGNDYFIGGSGNDILIGGAGADVFIFEGEFGNDIITDMWAGENRTDRIWLKGQGVDDFADLQTQMEQVGDNVLLTLDHGTITLQDTLIADLHMDDFIFG